MYYSTHRFFKKITILYPFRSPLLYRFQYICLCHIFFSPLETLIEVMDDNSKWCNVQWRLYSVHRGRHLALCLSKKSEIIVCQLSRDKPLRNCLRPSGVHSFTVKKHFTTSMFVTLQESSRFRPISHVVLLPVSARWTKSYYSHGSCNFGRADWSNFNIRVRVTYIKLKEKKKERKLIAGCNLNRVSWYRGDAITTILLCTSCTSTSASTYLSLNWSWKIVQQSSRKVTPYRRTLCSI